MNTESLSVDLGPIRLESPLIAAAGTVGSVVEFEATIDFSKYGAAVAKSVSPEPWTGRPVPRIGAVDAGMLNGIGIQNPGIDAWLDDTGPALSELAVQVWGSAVAHDVDGFAQVAEKMDAADVFFCSFFRGAHVDKLALFELLALFKRDCFDRKVSRFSIMHSFKRLTIID